MPTMNYDTVDSVLVTVHGREQPTTTEYDTWLRTVQSLMDTKSITGLIVYTAGGYPDAKQRRQTYTLWARYKQIPNIAVMHDSVIVRGAFTALVWVIGTTMQSFDLSQIVSACSHVGVAEVDVAPVTSTITKLARSVNVSVA